MQVSAGFNNSIMCYVSFDNLEDIILTQIYNLEAKIWSKFQFSSGQNQNLASENW